jgi:AraC-like DNA-binding protein/mannose-6-phosphate isomerase-like protein (cupin superfamily)
MRQWIDICREHIAAQLDSLEKGKFTLNCPTFPRNIKYPPRAHYHTTPELSSQISGIHIAHFPGQNIQIKPGDITVIPATLPHAGDGIKRESSLFMIVDCEQSELWIARGEVNYGEKPHSSILLTIKTPRKENLKQYMDHICDMADEKHKFYRFAVQGMLLACFSELMMILDEYESSAQYVNSPKILTAQRLVIHNLNDPRLNVDFISRLVPCSPAYLSQLFYKKTGVKLSRYIHEKRLEYAQQLLKITDMNIKEVAYSCGYSDPSYFIRLFRQQLGVSPRKYRKSLIK